MVTESSQKSDVPASDQPTDSGRKPEREWGGGGWGGGQDGAAERGWAGAWESGGGGEGGRGIWWEAEREGRRGSYIV